MKRTERKPMFWAGPAAAVAVALATLLTVTTASAGFFRPPSEGTIAAKMYEQCLKDAKTPWRKLLCNLTY